MEGDSFLGITAVGWSAISALISIGALVCAVWVAVVAHKALRSWKKQVDHDHRAITARNLLRESISLRNAINQFRSRPIILEQLNEHYNLRPETFAQELNDLLRPELTVLRESFADFECAFAEAKLLFDYGELAAAVYLLAIQNELFGAANNLVNCFDPNVPSETREEERKHLGATIDTLWKNRDSDELYNRLTSQSLELMRTLSNSLRRNA